MAALCAALRPKLRNSLNQPSISRTSRGRTHNASRKEQPSAWQKARRNKKAASKYDPVAAIAAPVTPKRGSKSKLAIPSKAAAEPNTRIPIAGQPRAEVRFQVT